QGGGRGTATPRGVGPPPRRPPPPLGHGRAAPRAAGGGSASVANEWAAMVFLLPPGLVGSDFPYPVDLLDSRGMEVTRAYNAIVASHLLLEVVIFSRTLSRMCAFQTPM